MTFEPDQPPADPDDRLFALARAGDTGAWDELFHKCYPKVIRVVRRKLDRPMRSLFDSTDFASDVMKSLAANAGRLDFPSFDSLMAFLVQVAEQKVIDEYRKGAHPEAATSRGSIRSSPPLAMRRGLSHWLRATRRRARSPRRARPSSGCSPGKASPSAR